MEPSNRHLSLTTLYKDEVQQFFEEAGFAGSSAVQLTTRLIASLVDFRIEGEPFFPVMYIVSDLAAMRELLGRHDYLHLGSSPDPHQAADNLLLKGAPLSTDRWKIVVHVHDGTVDYGLFAALELPLGHEPRHILVSRQQDRCNIVKLARIANRCVELESNRALTRRFFFSQQADVTYSPYELVNRIAGAIAQGAKEEIRPSLREYLFTSIKHGVLGAHGSLVAVIDRERTDLPPCFNDAVMFAPGVDIAARIERYLVQGGREDHRALQAVTDLLTGSLHSDGITLFRNDGTLLAYRVFCSLEQVGREIYGGARKRAFEALKRELREGNLTGAFIHSQDGWMDVVVKD